MSAPQHSERVADLSAALAREAGWNAPSVRALRAAAMLHDVGKLVFAAQALQVAQALGTKERHALQEAPARTAHALQGLLDADQCAWIRHHRERFDGLGYPDGLGGDSIPEGARLLGLADAWDAMTDVRPYRPPLAAGDALAEVSAEAGRQFCPTAARMLAALASGGRLESFVQRTVEPCQHPDPRPAWRSLRFALASPGY